MNNVNIIGRVGADPEIKYTPSGKAVTEINLAVDDGYGENKKTVWIGVTIWGATAECTLKYVRKGDRLGITGRLSQDEWEDKQTGKTQRKTKVTCQDMHLLMAKRDDGQRPAEGARSPEYGQRDSHQNGAPPPSTTATADSLDFDEDDDIAF